MSRAWIVLVASFVGCGHLGIEPEEQSQAPNPEHEGKTGGAGGQLFGDGGGPELGGDSSFGGMGGDVETVELPECAPNCDRTGSGLVLLYEFNEAGGSVARDSSSALPPLDLEIPESAPVAWVDSGISILETARPTSLDPAKKLVEAVLKTNELSLEVWVKPRDPLQSGPARYFTVSSDAYNRNFLLGQDEGCFVARLRTTQTEENGMPNLRSEPLVTKELTHVVYTHGADGVEKIYVNGLLEVSGLREGELSNWDDTFHLAIGDEFGEERREWQGQLYLVAVYSRALTAREVVQNFAAPH